MMDSKGESIYSHDYHGEQIEFQKIEDSFLSFFKRDTIIDQLNFKKDLEKLLGSGIQLFEKESRIEVITDKSANRDALEFLAANKGLEFIGTRYKHVATATEHIGTSSILILSNKIFTEKEIIHRTHCEKVQIYEDFYRLQYKNENAAFLALMDLRKKRRELEDYHWIEILEMNMFNYEDLKAKGKLIRNDIPPNTKLPYQKAFELTKTFDAHQYYKPLHKVKMGIFDVGLDPNHNDLSNLDAKLSYDFIQDIEGDPTSAQYDYHGTCCSGLAGARSRNGEFGLNGVGKDHTLISYRIGFGNLKADLFHMIRAFLQAIKTGIKVINCSWDIGPPYRSLETAINRAVTNGITVIFSAGNTGRKIHFPPSMDSVITVSGLDINDKPKEWNSNYVVNDWASSHGTGVDIAAPGENLITTDNVGGMGENESSYAKFSGTSSSAPLVAGCVAMMLGVNSNLKPTQIKEILITTSSPLCHESANDYGYGILNVDSAVQTAIKLMSNK